MDAEAKLHKYRKIQGNKNPEDIFDRSTWKKIQREIDFLRPNINELYNEEDLPPEVLSTLDSVREFCIELSENFKIGMNELIEEYQSEGRKIPEKILDYIEKKNFDLPTLTLAHGPSASKYLQEMDIDYRPPSNSLLLIFQLPKPLAQYWWKGGADSWGQYGEEIEGTAIEWGHFYREIMEKVWFLQGYYENEKELLFRRLNFPGEHDPKKYYYLWQIHKLTPEDRW